MRSLIKKLYVCYCYFNMHKRKHIVKKESEVPQSILEKKSSENEPIESCKEQELYILDKLIEKLKSSKNVIHERFRDVVSLQEAFWKLPELKQKEYYSKVLEAYLRIVVEEEGKIFFQDDPTINLKWSVLFSYLSTLVYLTYPNCPEFPESDDLFNRAVEVSVKILQELSANSEIKCAVFSFLRAVNMVDKNVWKHFDLYLKFLNEEKAGSEMRLSCLNLLARWPNWSSKPEFEVVLLQIMKEEPIGSIAKVYCFTILQKIGKMSVEDRFNLALEVIKEESKGSDVKNAALEFLAECGIDKLEESKIKRVVELCVPIMREEPPGSDILANVLEVLNRLPSNQYLEADDKERLNALQTDSFFASVEELKTSTKIDKKEFAVLHMKKRFYFGNRTSEVVEVCELVWKVYYEIEKNSWVQIEMRRLLNLLCDEIASVVQQEKFNDDQLRRMFRFLLFLVNTTEVDDLARTRAVTCIVLDLAPIINEGKEENTLLSELFDVVDVKNIRSNNEWRLREQAYVIKRVLECMRSRFEKSSQVRNFFLEHQFDFILKTCDVCKHFLESHFIQNECFELLILCGKESPEHLQTIANGLLVYLDSINRNASKYDVKQFFKLCKVLFCEVEVVSIDHEVFQTFLQGVMNMMAPDAGDFFETNCKAVDLFRNVTKGQPKQDYSIVIDYYLQNITDFGWMESIVEFFNNLLYDFRYETKIMTTLLRRSAREYYKGRYFDTRDINFMQSANCVEKKQQDKMFWFCLFSSSSLVLSVELLRLIGQFCLYEGFAIRYIEAWERKGKQMEDESDDDDD